VWPGATFVTLPSGDKIFLKFGDRRRIANDLKASGWCSLAGMRVEVRMGVKIRSTIVRAAWQRVCVIA
jgi:hypothetical protein